MVFQLSKEEVLAVCKECSNFDEANEACMKKDEPARTLNSVRVCKNWDEHYGDKCLFRG
jgi:hypothetical protein